MREGPDTNSPAAPEGMAGGRGTIVGQACGLGEWKTTGYSCCLMKEGISPRRVDSAMSNRASATASSGHEPMW